LNLIIPMNVINVVAVKALEYNVYSNCNVQSRFSANATSG